MTPVNLASLSLVGTLILAPAGRRAAGPVSGRIIVMDKGNKVAPDVGQAVVWLERASGPTPAPRSIHAVVTAENKTFTPHVAVVPAGSSITFPNRDGFDHNVFSLSEAGPFDLGLYERGDGKTVTFPTAGIIRVYCNIHSTMSAVIVVAGSPWYTQPEGDGSYSIPAVPPGSYVLHAWHERANVEVSVPVTVTATGAHGPEGRRVARGGRPESHMNKFGKPYARVGRRY